MIVARAKLTFQVIVAQEILMLQAMPPTKEAAPDGRQPPNLDARQDPHRPPKAGAQHGPRHRVDSAHRATGRLLRPWSGGGGAGSILGSRMLGTGEGADPNMWREAQHEQADVPDLGV